MASILVVDDYPVIQRILRLTLQINDHAVHTASNGVEALEILAEKEIDLIITDVSMPEMDGLALLTRLRTQQKYESLPIIVLTAIGQEDLRQVAVQKGASGFLTKPTSSQELVAAVTHFLTQT